MPKYIFVTGGVVSSVGKGIVTASLGRILRARGLRLIDEVPRPGIHGLVAFLHPQTAHGMMIELLQKDEAC